MPLDTDSKAQPKHLLLELLLASSDNPLPVSHAVAACAVFGLSENHVRVTLARLAAQDMVLTTERGAWRLGSAARSLAQDVANWRHAEQRLRPWNGQYVAVHCSALARSASGGCTDYTGQTTPLSFRMPSSGRSCGSGAKSSKNPCV